MRKAENWFGEELTPRSKVRLEKLTNSQLVKKFLAFYEHRKLNTVFTSARHQSLFWARSIQSMLLSHFLKIHFKIILQSKPGYSEWPLFLRFAHQNHLCTSLHSHTCYVSRPSYSSWFDHPNDVWCGVKVKSPSTGLEWPRGFQEQRFPYFMKTAQDGGKVVNLTHRPPLPQGNTPGTHFCQRLSRPQGHSATGRIMSLTNSNDTIGNRNHDLSVCSVVLRHRVHRLVKSTDH